MIIYQDNKDLKASELEDLFCSLNWESGKQPLKLAHAMQGSDAVITARDDGRLIGLVNAITDGHMIVYFHYLIVHPNYHGQGVGRNLMERMFSKYEHVHKKILIAYNEAVGFYKKMGLSVSENTTAMSM